MQVDIVKVEEVELDEMWSFVGKKSNQRWLWHAIDHNTHEVLAYHFGQRKDKAFKALQKKLSCFDIDFYSVHDKKPVMPAQAGNHFWFGTEIKPIKIKKHGRPAVSLFRYGLDFLCDSIVRLAYKTNHFQQALKILNTMPSPACS